MDAPTMSPNYTVDPLKDFVTEAKLTEKTQASTAPL
jgi:hypothetical protein